MEGKFYQIIKEIFNNPIIEKVKENLSVKLNNLIDNKNKENKDNDISQFVKELRNQYQSNLNKYLSNNLNYIDLGLFFTNLILWLCNNQYIPFSLTLTILEDVIETIPKDGIEKIFEVLSQFLKEIDLTQIEDRKLSLLKIKNIVLKRLSSSLDTKFRGKVQLLLSEIFKLSERSGVNLKGFYSNNSTLTIQTNEINKDNKNEINISFYKQFWILQRFLANPLYVRIEFF
jgi:hypothetical protein